MENINLTVANDIGNSTTKQIINGVLIKQPSVIKRVLVLPNVNETNVAKNVENLLEELLVNVNSRAIKRNGTFMIGRRANQTADQVENMNIKLGNKHKNDIPVLMTLSMNAAHSIQLSYRENKKLPEELNVNIQMSTGIPASEYSPEKAKELENRFTNDKHIVIVHVGDKHVTVKLNYEKVKVTQEGVPALFAILESDKDILEDYSKVYSKNLNPKDFKDKKILHADIGDGTTEYIYTIGLTPVLDACSGERRGVGHATQEAIKMLEEYRGGQIKFNRQRFMEVLRDPGDVANHEQANIYMKEAKYSQAYVILEDIKEKFISNTSSAAQLIAVYGGGSINFKDELYEELLDFAKEVGIEILWIPEKYAVDLNVEGMNVLNQKVLFKQKG